MAIQEQGQSLTLTRFSVNSKPAVSLPPFLGGPVFPLHPMCSRLKTLPPRSLLDFLSLFYESLPGWRGDFLSCPCQGMSKQPAHPSNSMANSQLHWKLWDQPVGWGCFDPAIYWNGFPPFHHVCPQIGNNNNNNPLLGNRAVPFPKLSLWVRKISIISPILQIRKPGVREIVIQLVRSGLEKRTRVQSMFCFSIHTSPP